MPQQPKKRKTIKIEIQNPNTIKIKFQKQIQNNNKIKLNQNKYKKLNNIIIINQILNQ